MDTPRIRLHCSFIHKSTSASRPKQSPIHIQFDSHGGFLKTSSTRHFQSAKPTTVQVTSPLATLANSPSPEEADECMFQIKNALRDERNVKTVVDNVMITHVCGCDMAGDAGLIDAEDVAIESLCVEGRCEKDEVTQELVLLQDQLRSVLQQNQTFLQTIQPQVGIVDPVHRRWFRPTPPSSTARRRWTICWPPTASTSAIAPPPPRPCRPRAAACATTLWTHHPCSAQRAAVVCTRTATGT